MSDYITNSKNRKLKTKILLFFSRINIGAGKLPVSGRIILLMEVALVISLFFPWVHMVTLDNTIHEEYAFSPFMLFIGYLILFSVTLVPFFLLSHSKKEYIRSLVPFRLSDTQAIVFLMSMVLMTLIHIVMLSRLYADEITLQGATLSLGFKIAAASTLSIIFSAYFLSKSTKQSNTEMYYLDHHRIDELQEYQDIIHPHDAERNKNMSLPI